MRQLPRVSTYQLSVKLESNCCAPWRSKILRQLFFSKSLAVMLVKQKAYKSLWEELSQWSWSVSSYGEFRWTEKRMKRGCL